MAEIDERQFCALATSQRWQSWLFDIDQEYYRSFIKEVMEAAGCTGYRKLMLAALDHVQKIGALDKLFAFLREHFPFALIDPNRKMSARVEQPPLPTSPTVPPPFDAFRPGALTFPHRHIMSGRPEAVTEGVSKFLAKKLAGDYVQFGGTAFIEYLNHDETEILRQLPAAKWVTKSWKAAHGQQK